MTPELTTKEIARLHGVVETTVQRWAKKEKWPFRLVTGLGGSRPVYPLVDLKPKTQLLWVQANLEAAKELPDEVRQALCVQAQWEIVRAEAPRDEIDRSVLTDPASRARLEKMMPAIQEVLYLRRKPLPRGERSARIKLIAEKAGVDRATLYRWVQKYREGGMAALIAPKRKRGPEKWSPAALEYLKGVYLKGLRQGGITRRRAIEAVMAEAGRRGWRVGSVRSAYCHLEKLHPLLIRYAKGGRRALDNAVYILRRYDDLEPFECIVGDQNTVDFFVQDPETGRVFRPQGYFWLDLRTRLVYGFCLAGLPEMRHYNAAHMGLALRMGLSRFGRFKTCYNDNGKPERSRYFGLVAGEMRSGGLESRDIADLYKTADGEYACEVDGNVVDAVESPRAWRRFARAYNAKAKPIERFFQTLRGILRDLGTPGGVKELGGDPEENKLAAKRLDRLARAGRLLTPEEFLLKVFEAVEVYNHRRHSALGRSPMEELQAAVEREGFKPTFLPEDFLEYAFLARVGRKVNRGRVRVDGRIYEADELHRLPTGAPVEVRYDPYDHERALAVLPDGSALDLKLTAYASMKDRAATAEAMSRKREFMRLIMDRYRELTRPVPGVVKFSTMVRPALELGKRRRAEAEAGRPLPAADLAERTRRIIARSGKQQKVVSLSIRPKAFRYKTDRYRWCIEALAAGMDLSVGDRAFMAEFEAGMTPEELKRWNLERTTMGLAAIAGAARSVESGGVI